VNRLAGFLFLAFALVAAIGVHRHTHMEPFGLGFDRPVCAVRDSWQDPLAFGIGIVGFLVAGILGYVDHRGNLCRPV
jgi:type IV secretory pathway VirB2 component (pilin)